MNEKKNVSYAASCKEIAAIDLKELLSVYADMKRMHCMLKTLIAALQREEKLKQHHCPYLELRREMLAMCEDYLKDLAEIAVRTEMPVNGCPIEHSCKSEHTGEKTDNQIFFAMLDDLLVLAEHTDNMTSFMKLLMNGVDLVGMPIEYGEQVERETSEMVDRWEEYLRAATTEGNP